MLIAAPVCARDAQTVGQWLCSHLFSGPGATLAFCENGFFALRLENSRKEVQNISGLWRLDPDAISLTLMTLQDARLKMSVGQEAIHTTLPNLGPTTLFPAPLKSVSFLVTGMLERDGEGFALHDASSGMTFPVPENKGESGKFATAEVEISPAGAHLTRIVSHSAPVPRYYLPPETTTGDGNFRDIIPQKYWLLPPGQAISLAALRFGPPNAKNCGSFEISGPGLRFEGDYTLNGDKLTLTANRANITALKSLGLEDIAHTFLATHNWRHSSRGLELTSNGRKVLLLPYRPD